MTALGGYGKRGGVSQSPAMKGCSVRSTASFASDGVPNIAKLLEVDQPRDVVPARGFLLLFRASEPVILSAAGAKDLREGSVHTRPTRSANGQRTVRTAADPQTPAKARRNVANGPGPSACSSAHTADQVPM